MTSLTTTTINKKSNIDSSNTHVKSFKKLPRAPIACFRCHHKKVRCDGIHPNCTRCLTTGVLCAYPSSRRSRTAQPMNVDPFIDNLSHLEARIRRIESDLETQRTMVHSIVSSPTNNNTANELSSKMLKIEMEVQDSRSILAQLRLRGEQRIAKLKRAASVAAAATTTNKDISPSITKEKDVKQESSTKSLVNNKKVNNKKLHISPSTSVTAADKYHQRSFYFQGMMLDGNTDINAYDDNSTGGPPGHGMDWTLFDHPSSQQQQRLQQEGGNLFATTTSPISSSTAAGHHLMFPNNYNKMVMEVSSIPVSPFESNHFGEEFPVTLHLSNSTTSTKSNATTNTSCSSSISDNLFSFNIEDMMFHESSSQDLHILSNNPSVWYCHHNS